MAGRFVSLAQALIDCGVVVTNFVSTPSGRQTGLSESMRAALGDGPLSVEDV